MIFLSFLLMVTKTVMFHNHVNAIKYKQNLVKINKQLKRIDKKSDDN